MLKRELNALVTKALVDSKFRADILNGHRKERLQEFSFTSAEYKTLLSIEAKTLDQFIHQIAHTMTQANTHTHQPYLGPH